VTPPTAEQNTLNASECFLLVLCNAATQNTTGAAVFVPSAGKTTAAGASAGCC